MDSMVYTLRGETQRGVLPLLTLHGRKYFAGIGVFETWGDLEGDDVGPFSLPSVQRLRVVSFSDGDSAAAHAVPAANHVHSGWRHASALQKASDAFAVGRLRQLPTDDEFHGFSSCVGPLGL